MCVNPADGDDGLSHLYFEQFHFVSHHTLVVTACLRGQY
jgi:hypothetical protein